MAYFIDFLLMFALQFFEFLFNLTVIDGEHRHLAFFLLTSKFGFLSGTFFFIQLRLKSCGQINRSILGTIRTFFRLNHRNENQHTD